MFASEQYLSGKTLMSRKTLFIIIPVTLILLMGLGVVIAVDNPEYYREQIKTTAETETGFEIQINGDLNWRYWPPIAISIEDVDIRPIGSDTPLATLKSAAIDLKLLPLIFGGGNIAINGLNIDGLKLNAFIDEQGRGNWEVGNQAAESTDSNKTGSESASQDSLDLDIGAMSITNAAMSYIDESTGEHYEVILESLTTGAVSYSEQTPISFDLGLVDKVSGLSSKVNGKGGLSFNPSFTQFGLVELNIENSMKIPDMTDLNLKLTISGDINTAQGTASLSQLDFQLAELNGSVAVNVTDMNTTPKLDGQITIAPFNVKSLMKTLTQQEIKTTNPAALNAVSFSAKLGGNAENIKLTDISGKIDSSTITGRLALRTGSKLTSSFDLNLDQISVSDYLEPTSEASSTATEQASTPAVDSEVLPLALLNENNINGKFTISQMMYETYTLSHFTTTIVNANQQLKVTASGKGYDGAINMEFVAKTGSNPSGRTNIQLEGMDVTKLAEFEALTGTIELNSNAKFSGVMLSEVLATLDGDSEFNIKDGTLDVKPIKNIAAVIDGLRGETSAVASWPDIMPFKSMVGSHQLNQGVAKNQQLNMTIENLSVSGTGGLDYWNDKLAYDMEVTLHESVDGQFTVGPAMAGIRWPLQCAGSMDATVAELCTPNSDTLSKLVAQILAKELQRQGTEKLKEKGKKFLKGLFN
jgi:AsmA protein